LRPPRGFYPVLAALTSLLPDLAAALPLRTYYFRDFSVTFYPLRLFAARELAAGRWPFWNPYIYEGSFFLPVLYPLDLLHALFPGPVAVSWLLTLHLPLAALGAYGLARELGAEPPGAFVAGAVYALGGLSLSSLNLYVFLQALAWAPFVVLMLRRAAQRGGRTLVFAAMVVGVALTTLAVEFVAQALVLGAALGIAAAFGTPPEPGAAAALSRRALLWRLALAIALGAGLAAVPVAVIAGILKETVRGAGFPGDVALGNSVPPLGLLQALVPNLFGSLADPVQAWWGGRFFSKGLPYFLSLYVGSLTIALAAAGVSRLERGTRIVLLGFAFLALWLSLGAAGGLGLLAARLHLFDVFRFPSKALLLVHLALSLGAGLGFDRLRRGDGWRTFTVVAAGLLAAILTLAAIVSAGGLGLAEWAGIDTARWPGVAAAIRGDVLSEALVIVGALAAALAVGRRRETASVASLLVGTLTVLALVRAGAGMNPQTSAAFFRPLPEMVALRLHDLGGGRVFSYGIDWSPAFRAFLAQGRGPLRLASFSLNRQVLAPYNNVVDRVEAPEATDLTSFVPRSRELAPAHYDPRAVGTLLPWLRNAAVSRVLSLDPLEHPDLEQLARVPMGAGLFIHAYRLRDPGSRAYVACRVVRADPADALRRPYAADFDAARDVALAEEAQASCRDGRARGGEEAPSAERYDVHADGAGVLVVRASFARGWSATVDGLPAPVLVANGKHRGVPVPAGDHEVRLRYRAPGLYVGLSAALISALALASLLVLSRSRPPDTHVAARPEGVPPLVCPRCRQPLSVDRARARCAACGVDYAWQNGILHLTAGKEGAPGYDPHYFSTFEEVEKRHFWFVARRRLIRDVLGRAVGDLRSRRLFDIGCGSGGLLAFLRETGVPLAGAGDAYLESLEIVRRRVDAPLVLIDEGRLPPLGQEHSLLSLFDVLEHIDADEETLRFLHSVLEPGGVLVLTVPAHPFLFDEMDEIAHHRRRYTRGELRGKLESAGFEVPVLTHFMSILVPPLVVLRFLGRRLARGHGAQARREAEFRVVPVFNQAMLGLLALERALIRWTNLPFGSSLLAVARRPGAPSGGRRDREEPRAAGHGAPGEETRARTHSPDRRSL